jgi:hypothetical protein
MKHHFVSHKYVFTVGEDEVCCVVRWSDGLVIAIGCGQLNSITASKGGVEGIGVTIINQGDQPPEGNTFPGVV